MLDQFVRQFQDGCDVVYGVRSKRETDTFFKRNTALAFYRVMKTLGVDLVYNHADYRLMSRRALDALADYRETNLFLRGIVPLIGFRSGTVTYERHERFAGAIVCSIWLLGGIQLLCIGVLGGYIGKIYNEVKDRPRYLIEEELR